MTRKVGIDISKWQGSWTPNDKAKFVIMRSGYGRMPDKLFETFYDAAYLYGMPRGAYHYFSSAVPWMEQVDFFLEQTDGRSFNKFALDVEPSYNNSSKDFALCAVKWIDTIARETGVETWLYTNGYTYRDWLRIHTAEVDRIKLWIAQYPRYSWGAFLQALTNKMTGEPYMKVTGREDWSMWQYTDKAPGKDYGVDSHGVDLDILNGNETFVVDGLPDIPDVPDVPSPPNPPTPSDVTEHIDGILSGVLGDYDAEVNITLKKRK